MMDDENLDEGLTAALATALPRAGTMPRSTVDLDSIVRRGRRRVVVRRAGVATGGTAAVALLAFGLTRVPSGSGAAAVAGSKSGASTTASTLSKSGSVQTCDAPSTVDWAKVIGDALPTGLTGYVAHAPTCSTGGVKGEVVEVEYTLNHNAGSIEIDDGTDTLKASLGTDQTGDKSPSAARGSRLSAAEASAEALKSKAAATNQSAPVDQTCSTDGSVQVCTQQVSKGPFTAVVAMLSDHAHRRYVQVVASPPSAASHAPLTESQAKELAEAVLAAG